ncbi:hypothetical protein BpHYR1_016951 [Brachionus plicatilis]|uniref:Uncharacterized protein n=1 Tax=Brachionus plicatilis TaxID=10195 RepID=A0A3M7SRW3_BRAPC|nr:hypothetical protein BpHYR1_016951 [Brachionus plicatilis]
MHHIKAKSLAFKLDKLTKIYKEMLESAFSNAKSKDEFDDRGKNVEELKTSLDLKIKDSKSEEQIISSEDKDEEMEYLKSKLYSLSTELEEKEYEINTLKTEKQNILSTDEQSSETEDQSIENKKDYNTSMPKTRYCETSFKQTQFAKQNLMNKINLELNHIMKTIIGFQTIDYPLLLF